MQSRNEPNEHKKEKERGGNEIRKTVSQHSPTSLCLDSVVGTPPPGPPPLEDTEGTPRIMEAILEGCLAMGAAARPMAKMTTAKMADPPSRAAVNEVVCGEEGWSLLWSVVKWSRWSRWPRSLGWSAWGGWMARADSFLFKALVFLIRGLWLGFGIERETSWEENSRGYFLEKRHNFNSFLFLLIGSYIVTW